MKVNFFWTGLALIVSSCCMAIGDDGEGRYRIVSERMPAKAGDEVELLAESVQCLKIEGEVNDQKILKTKMVFSQLKAKVRIVRWDATNKFGTAEFDVEHLIKGDGSETNKLLVAGDKVIATYIGSEIFYKSPKSILASEVRHLMDELGGKPMGVRNGKHTGIFAVTKEDCKVGDCWDVSSAEVFEEIEKSKQKSVTNQAIGTKCIIGLTNVFNVKCFQLGLNAKGSPGVLPSSLFHRFLPMDSSEVVSAEGEVNAEITYPFDVSLPPLIATRTMVLRGRFSRRGNLADIEVSGVTRFVYKPILKSEKH